MPLSIRPFWIGCCLVMLATSATSATQARLLVASTQPLYLIAQAVTQGIEQPTLLIPAQQDGHHVQIKPEGRRSVQQADLVLWVGAEYEAGLSSLLSSKPNAVALTSLPTLQRLPLRDLDGQPRPSSLDPHVWLAPYNAIFTAHLIANVRAIQYPQDAARYQRNAAIFTTKLQQAMPRIPPNRQTYWAYHDAYQYLEKPLGLQLAAALTPDPELPPTARRLQQVIQQRPSRAPCMFIEAHTPQAIIQRLMPVKLVMIDETMRDAADFVSGWRQLAQQMRQCVDAQR